MKKLVASILISAMALTTVACGSSSTTEPTGDTGSTASETTYTAENPLVLTFAEVNPPDSIVGQMDQKFADEVERLSEGTMIIDIQGSGVLGSESDVLDSMLGGGGTVDMARISAFALTSYGGEKSKLLSIPYTFEDRDHFWNFATSDLAQEFLIEPSENGSGIRGLFYGEEGFRHFFTKEPVNSIEDLAGMKLRVSNDPVMQSMVTAFGADPTVVSMGELYSSLQTGVVDGAEQPISNYLSNAFQEVAPNLILDGHTLGAVEVIITDEAWNSLTTEQQDILVEAGKTAQDFNREMSEQAEQEALAELEAQGVNIVEVEDKTPWKEACADVITDAVGDQTELYQQILDMNQPQ